MGFTPVTDVQAHAHLRRQGIPADRGAVATALAAVNQDAIYAKHRARITHEVWDKKTPINGCTPELVLAQPGHNVGGEIYLLKVDGNVVFIQPFVPGVAGYVKMTPANVDGIAKEHGDSVATSMAHGEIMAAVEGLL